MPSPVGQSLVGLAIAIGLDNMLLVTFLVVVELVSFAVVFV